jgi:hypothetical protein
VYRPRIQGRETCLAIDDVLVLEDFVRERPDEHIQLVTGGPLDKPHRLWFELFARIQPRERRRTCKLIFPMTDGVHQGLWNLLDEHDRATERLKARIEWSICWWLRYGWTLKPHLQRALSWQIVSFGFGDALCVGDNDELLARCTDFENRRRTSTIQGRPFEFAHACIVRRVLLNRGYGREGLLRYIPIEQVNDPQLSLLPSNA